MSGATAPAIATARCPSDPLKTDPGICGCGLPDTQGIGGCDRNGDGVYNAEDVRLAMAEYGITEASDCQGDVNGDGIVNAADLGIVIGVWGNCP